MPRKYFSGSCKHIYGYVLPSATEKLRLQKDDLTRVERVCLGCFSSSLNGFKKYAWRYKLFKPCSCSCQSSLPYSEQQGDVQLAPNGLEQQEPPGTQTRKMEVTAWGVLGCLNHRGIRQCSDAMTAFPSWANATGEGILHC